MSGNHDHQSPDAGPSKHPLSRRLPQEAYAVLNGVCSRHQSTHTSLSLIHADYYYNVTNRPTKPQRMELIRQIHKIPGCDWYTEGNVQRFAASKRKAQRHAAASKDNSTVVRAICDSIIAFPRPPFLLNPYLSVPIPGTITPHPPRCSPRGRS